jgi:DNA mismatch endonuclease (patch repair protein)
MATPAILDLVMRNMERSAIMRAVKARNTKPEMIVRQLVYRLGFRYRLHRSDLPGTPDLVFASRRKVILVHGCFWHGHTCRRGARIPKTNIGYWRDKIRRNRRRDAASMEALRQLGWDPLVVWECQLADAGRLIARIECFLLHTRSEGP